MRIDLAQPVSPTSGNSVAEFPLSAPATSPSDAVHTELNPVNQGSVVELESRNTIVREQDGERSIYQVLDKESGRVICQIPSEEVLRVAQKLEEIFGTDEIEQQIDSKF